MLTYTELSKLKTFDERFKYLIQNGVIGEETFGGHRHMNQAFYKSSEWKRVRDYVILRDMGRDLGVPGLEIHGTAYVHHMNSITIHDLKHASTDILDPEYLITCSYQTHAAITYGTKDYCMRAGVTVRKEGDTALW